MTNSTKGPWLWIGGVIPLALILAAGLGYAIFRGDPDAAGPDAANPPALDPDRTYYFAVRAIELYPTRPDGKAWDVSDSGPDIAYDLTWQNNTVFTAAKRSDTLIASWDMLSVDLKAAILSGQVDLGSSIQGALVRPAASNSVVVKVWDADLTNQDPAGTIQLQLDQLQLGDNTLTYPASDTSAIKQITLRLVDQSLPTAELIEAATRP